jgi:hypothetical protein
MGVETISRVQATIYGMRLVMTEGKLYRHYRNKKIYRIRAILEMHESKGEIVVAYSPVEGDEIEREQIYGRPAQEFLKKFKAIE